MLIFFKDEKWKTFDVAELNLSWRHGPPQKYAGVHVPGLATKFEQTFMHVTQIL